ncbi:MAG: cobalamin biosynthesis protein [Candidatus Omnitrophica bacterium]|nr:cobalamin biosynthesis protein [Candidatus Omnitrophota bacterium]
MKKNTARLWIGLVILVILSPLGVILPKYFKAGTAWGEWGADEMRKLVGYIPFGFDKLSTMWNAPLSGYIFKGWDEKGLGHLSLSYLASAILGIAITVAIMLFLGRILTKKR